MKYIKALMTWGLLLVATHVLGVNITVEPIEIEPGGTASLIINMANTETDLTAYQMYVYLPEGVTIQKKTNGKYNYTANADRHDGAFTITVKDAADGSVLVTCFSADKDVLSGTSGELITLPLDIASTVTTSLQGSIRKMEFTSVSAQATKPADINFALTLPGSTPPIGDSDELTVSVPDINITAGGTANLVINMGNTATDLTAYQMYVYLPEGVTIQKKANGKYDYTANADRHDGAFTITVKDAADGSVLVACFSADKDVLSGTSGELITLPLDIASTVTTSLQGSIRKMEFTSVSAQATKPADVIFNITLNGGTGEELQPANIAEGIYLLKNVDTGLYLNKGNSWGMHAVLSEEGMPVRISQQEDGSYTLYFPYGSVNQQLLFRDDHENVYVDYNGQEEGCPYWTITQQGNRYYIQSLTTHPVYGQEAMPGTYLGNNPEKEAYDQDGNAMGVYNDVDGNVTVGMNIEWLIEADGPHTAAQEETLSQLIATLQELGLDSSWAQSVLDNSASTYSEMFGAICDASQRIEQQQQEIALYNAQQRQELQRELQRLISSARQLGMSTTEAEAVVDNDNASMEEIRTTISTLRTDFITRLGEGIDNSLLPLDVTGVISNPTFSIDDAYGWDYDDDNAPQFQTYHNAEYFQTAFDLHQTLTDLPNGSYMLRMKGYHRPGNNQTVFTQFKEGTNNASAELYANDEHIVLQHQATGARDNENLGGAEVSYGDQTWYVPNSMQEARSWFDAEEGYFENELPVTVTDGTLTLGVRLGESVDEGWVIFDDFRLEYLGGEDTEITYTDISQLDNVIYLDPTEVRAGSEATLSLKMKNSAQIRGFQFDLYLPTGVAVVKKSNGRIQSELSADRLPEDDAHTLTTSQQADGAIRFLCSSQYDETFTGNDGEIVTLKVTVADDMADGDYAIELKDIKLTETNIQYYYEMPLVTTKLTVASYMLGDINADGLVDVSDYTGVANHIHANTPEGFVAKAADVDENGSIDVSDYTGIANIIHTGSIYGVSGTRARKAPSLLVKTNVSAADNVIYVEPFIAEAGTEGQITFAMRNTTDIRGFQFDLYLPEGVSVVKKSTGRIVGELCADRLPEDDEHDLSFSEQADGAIRILCSSLYEETFTGNDGPLMTLKVKYAADMAEGDYPIVMRNMKLTENDISMFYQTEYLESILTIGASIPGDVNGDERVTIADVTMVVDYLMGRSPANFNAAAADVDGVGGVTIADALAIVNIILGKDSTE